ncbi:MAG: phosphoribosylformylglycinamidine synthase subunit PurL [Planctomycetes bacterium]|nr:phosphoribosylformylglycinamidine synthase subunit PurL [Planctomycetota bacterium]
MLWEIDIHSADHPSGGARQADRAGERVAAAARELGLADNLRVTTARGFLVQGQSLDKSSIVRLANELLVDAVVERAVIGTVGNASLTDCGLRHPEGTRDCGLADGSSNPKSEIRNPKSSVPTVTVLLKPGVMDPVAQSALMAAADLAIHPEAIATLRKYWIDGADDAQIETIGRKLLANDAIEQVFFGPLELQRLEVGHPYKFELRTIALRDLNDDALMRLSREGQLYLQLAEMQTIQRHFRELGREPSDAELETIAQTWSEHCSHKTLAGRIAYRDEHGERHFENMLKETIFAATREIRERLGSDDWCVSVFEDNAGVVRFDNEFNLAFKVETHNHPSALEPYGGANTGVGGVIRDVMGTGLGAKPIASTDVFCFAPPDLGLKRAGASPPPIGAEDGPARSDSAETLPAGVIHPRRVMRGVVEGVRDYGNRMGIPTVNGAVYFDVRYLGNPLVYCGNVGLLPRDKSYKRAEPGDLIVTVGGRTGRDGIHGATFSSAELTSHSEHLSGGAVQIGNAIEEKKVLDVLLAARDRGLFHAVTDCGAGGFSSAVGEMGEKIGVEVHLDRAPLKYEGLSYTEIWIAEAQERMVLAVPEDRWPELDALCQSENVEATVIGRFVPTGRLQLFYNGERVADLAMQFLHKGRPPVVRQAVYERLRIAAPRGYPGLRIDPPNPQSEIRNPKSPDHTATLLRILASLNVASKEWIVRQYDHEVQGGSVVKPFVGAANDGPSDAAVLRPVLGSRRGVVIACGMNPHYGDFDPYHMAASAIDEAVRNCVAVGADPQRIAILDNFCWGDCERPETLGSLVRAAIACHDVAIALGTPFISGKDSLNNEFSYTDSTGQRQTIAIPSSLLISAMGQVEDVSRCVTMDLKQPGNLLYLVGETRDELGGSHFNLVNDLQGGQVPTVNPERACRTFAAVHRAINSGLVRACHDLSEGGLTVAAAEMAFAGGFGARIEIDAMPASTAIDSPSVRLFSESNTRFLCEVLSERADEFERVFSGVPSARIGEVVADERLVIAAGGTKLIDAGIAELKHVWQGSLGW